MNEFRFPRRAHQLIVSLRPAASTLYRLKITGGEKLPKDEGYLLVGNHLSSFDAVSLMDFCDRQGFIPTIMGKATLFEVPIIKHLMKYMRVIPVYRGTSRAKEAMDIAAEYMKRGAVVAMFPEGTTTREENYWPMTAKTGAARLALRTGCTVMPYAHWGTHRVQPRYSFVPRIGMRHQVRVLVGDPIDLSDLKGGEEDYDTVRLATARIMHEITSLLEVLREEEAPDVPYDMKIDGDPFFAVPSLRLAKTDRRMIRTQMRRRRRGMRQLLGRFARGQNDNEEKPLPRREATLLVSSVDLKGRALPHLPAVAQTMRDHGIKVRVRICTPKDDLSQVVKNYGSSRVVAVFGSADFINKVASHLVDTDRILAPLPAGADNPLTDYLDIPTSVESLVERWGELLPRRVDVIEIRHEDGSVRYTIGPLRPHQEKTWRTVFDRMRSSDPPKIWPDEVEEGQLEEIFDEDLGQVVTVRLHCRKKALPILA